MSGELKIMFNRFFFIYLWLLLCLPANEVFAEKFWYSFDHSSDHKKVFTPTMLEKPENSKPAVLLIRKNDDAFDDVMPVLHYLRKNSSMFTCPVVPQPIVSYSIFGKIPEPRKKYFQSWEAQKLFYSWDESQHRKTKNLHKAYFYKLDFLKASAFRLDKILTDWQEKVLPVDYLSFKDLKQSVERSELSYREFLKRLFALMDKLSLKLDEYPQLYSFNELVLKNTVNPSYPDDQVSGERDLFNDELSKKSNLISNLEINFLLETVIDKQISMASFKHLMELMEKLQIDFINNYPAYYNFLYRKAWYYHLRSEQAQTEISSCMRSVYDKVKPDKNFLLIEKWVDFKNALLNLTQGKISYDEYQLLKLRLRVYKQGAVEEQEKQVLREIRAIWNDTIQDQIHEVLRDYYNYAICYENMFEQYKSLLKQKKTDIVMVLTDYYDLPAMFFWFSSIKTGAVIELVEPEKEQEPDNNYFKLMRGERSPFEKLLEGIGED